LEIQKDNNQVKMGKRGKNYNSLILLNCIFFTSYIQLFLRHVSENTALLLLNRPKPFIDKVISQEQNREQQGATKSRTGARKGATCELLS
jgi:hypothetical protein